VAARQAPPVKVLPTISLPRQLVSAGLQCLDPVRGWGLGVVVVCGGVVVVVRRRWRKRRWSGGVEGLVMFFCFSLKNVCRVPLLAHGKYLSCIRVLTHVNCQRCTLSGVVCRVPSSVGRGRLTANTSVVARVCAPRGNYGQ
jgi:hypothetical protein